MNPFRLVRQSRLTCSDIPDIVVLCPSLNAVFCLYYYSSEPILKPPDSGLSPSLDFKRPVVVGAVSCLYATKGSLNREDRRSCQDLLDYFGASRENNCRSAPIHYYICLY